MGQATSVGAVVVGVQARQVRDIVAVAAQIASVPTKVGDPARALASVAEEHDAAMIVVGTRTGHRRIVEFFNGSVAARLIHQQHRPVLVVPVGPGWVRRAVAWDAA